MRLLFLLLAATVVDADTDATVRPGAKPKSSAPLCTEEAKRNSAGAMETCAQAYDRGVPCNKLYLTHTCCTRCDPCGFDASLCPGAQPGSPWLSPSCPCEQVILTGGCSYKGCAKPHALGVFSRRSS